MRREDARALSRLHELLREDPALIDLRLDLAAVRAVCELARGAPRTRARLVAHALPALVTRSLLREAKSAFTLALARRAGRYDRAALALGARLVARDVAFVAGNPLWELLFELTAAEDRPPTWRDLLALPRQASTPHLRLV